MFDESIKGASDWDFYLRLAMRYKFVSVPESHVLYRMHADQLHKKSSLMNTAKIKVMDKTFGRAMNERPDLINWVRRNYGRMLYRMGRSQLIEEHNPVLALDTLSRSRTMWRWGIRVHWLTALAILEMRYKRSKRP